MEVVEINTVNENTKLTKYEDERKRKAIRHSAIEKDKANLGDRSSAETSESAKKTKSRVLNCKLAFGNDCTYVFPFHCEVLSSLK